MNKFAVLALLFGGLLATAACGGGATTIPEPAPTFSDVTPGIGSLLGGTPITITGTGLTPDTAVRLGDKEVVNLVWVDEHTMTCETPVHPGGTNAGIQITNPNGTVIALGVFFYIPAPTLTSLSPNTGQPPGGVQTTLSGTGFTAYDAGTNIVTFGGLPATNVVTVNDTTIRCIVPSGNGPTTVQVTNNNGTATLESGYRYFPPPTVTNVTPAVGTALGGTDVIVKGTGFEANSPGPAAVSIGGAACTDIVVVNDTTITCKTPVGTPGPANVQINNLNGSGQLPGGFEFHPYPTVTSVSPPNASYEGGVTATIEGSGFIANDAGTNTVTFDGVAATNVVIISDTELTCTTPATNVGSITVGVSNDNGLGQLTDAITIVLDGLFGSAGTQLYKINPTTGATTAIGSGIGHTPNALAIDANGTLFGITNTDLISINPVTGVGSVVAGLAPAPTSEINELAFVGTRLIGMASAGWQAPSANSYEINTTDGTVTTKSTFTSPDGNSRRGMEYDGTFLIFMRAGYNSSSPAGLDVIDVDSGSRSTVSSVSGIHACVAIGKYKGTLYFVNSAQFTNGAENQLSLYSVNSGLTTGTYLGDLPGGMTAIAGSN